MDKSGLTLSRSYENSRSDAPADESQLFYCSHLFCSDYERDGLFIRFKSKVSFRITSTSYKVILHFVQQFFSASKIKFGFAEFKVNSLVISQDAEHNPKENYEVIYPISYNINEILNLVERRKIV